MTRAGLWVAAVVLVLSASGYFLLLYASAAPDHALPGPIEQADLRIAQYFMVIRNPGLVGFFTGVTAFGSGLVIFLLAGSSSIVLWLVRRAQSIAGWWLALIGTEITVFLLKALFARPRPEFAIYRESSAAFPSGHSAASVAFFGFLTYILIRERIGTRVITAGMGLLLILMVGLSRLYLGEHYVSEVVSGYLVGAVWVVLGICLAESMRAADEATEIRQTSPWRRFAAVAVVACAAIALWFAVEMYQLGLKVADVSLSGPLSPSTPIAP